MNVTGKDMVYVDMKYYARERTIYEQVLGCFLGVNYLRFVR